MSPADAGHTGIFAAIMAEYADAGCQLEMRHIFSDIDASRYAVAAQRHLPRLADITLWLRQLTLPSSSPIRRYAGLYVAMLLHFIPHAVAPRVLRYLLYFTPLLPRLPICHASLSQDLPARFSS